MKRSIYQISVMLLSGLSSTLDSALCATSSLVAVDLFGGRDYRFQTHAA